MRLSHISDDDLDLYIIQKLTPSRIGDLAEHLLICESCRDALDKTAALFAVVRRASNSHGHVMSNKRRI
jgi:predicted anti-sigma-YlaC factor YlaD